MKSMKVSIITCTYNSAATVADTIRSVNRQTYDNIEHIIVDGLSKDDTIAIVKANAGDRQRIIEGKDKGIYDAFNKGIQRSNGIYVWIVNSDDYIEPQALKELAQLIESFPKDYLPIIASSMRFIHQSPIPPTIYTPNEELGG